MDEESETVGDACSLDLTPDNVDDVILKVCRSNGDNDDVTQFKVQYFKRKLLEAHSDPNIVSCSADGYSIGECRHTDSEIEWFFGGRWASSQTDDNLLPNLSGLSIREEPIYTEEWLTCRVVAS